ncbi:tetratricopeptide repeat protein [Candidatus Shapirobacteria bacterium]|nr:tetratricopeptide repeat protein [Candidatus Shapirobacteria bacterium]
MTLNHSQKIYLKKNLKKLPLSQIAKNLNLEEKIILEYLKNTWSKEKYKRFLKNLNGGNVTTPGKSPLTNIANNLAQKAATFSFKNFFKKNWKVFVFLAFLVFVVYANSLNNEFLSDDIPAIKENKNIDNFYSYVLVTPLNFIRNALFFFVHKLFGLNPLFYRLVNVFFHLGSVFLVYIILSLLSNSFLALLTAGIFAVHPIEIESVTWITGGPHSQYSFFLLLAFLLYILAKYRPKPIKLYVFSSLSFALALTTTEKSLILPFIILSFELAFGSLKQNWRKLIPYFSLMTIMVFYIFSLGALFSRLSALETQYYQRTGSLNNPFLQIPVALISYIRLIIWPDKLTLYHSEMTFPQGVYALMVFLTLVLFALIFWTYKKNRQIFFWLSFFVIALLPMLTPFRIGWVVAERYVYLGSIGIIFLIALAIYQIGKYAQKRIISLIIFAVLILAFSTRTVLRNFDWKSQDTLWVSAAKISPSSHQNHNNLGDLYARQGNYEKAIEEFQTAIQLKPDYGDAYHNLANIYHQVNRDDLALENYQKALEFNHNLWQSYQNIAAIYFSQKKLDLSKEAMEKALAINPNNTDLYANMGILYLNLGDKQKAKEAFEQALQIDPQNEKAKQQLELIK